MLLFEFGVDKQDPAIIYFLFDCGAGIYDLAIIKLRIAFGAVSHVRDSGGQGVRRVRVSRVSGCQGVRVSGCQGVRVSG